MNDRLEHELETIKSLREVLEKSDGLMTVIMQQQAEISRLRAELAAEREKNRWTPVWERLPEDERFYEISRFFGDVNRRTTDIALYHNVLKLWIGRDSVERKGVTHYRPLPAPPKIEEEQ